MLLTPGSQTWCRYPVYLVGPMPHPFHSRARVPKFVLPGPCPAASRPYQDRLPGPSGDGQGALAVLGRRIGAGSAVGEVVAGATHPPGLVDIVT